MMDQERLGLPLPRQSPSSVRFILAICCAPCQPGGHYGLRSPTHTLH